jgi:hypothetical protein
MNEWPYSFANTPLHAAHAPLAIASMSHDDLPSDEAITRAL